MDELSLNACKLWPRSELALRFPGEMELTRLGMHYLDNAATTQRLGSAVERQSEVEAGPIGNANRGAHKLAAQSSDILSNACSVIADFLGVGAGQLALVSGATEAANLMAQSARANLKEGDCVYVSQIEHHSNFLPWQQAASERGARFVCIPSNASGELDLDWFQEHVPMDRPNWMAISAMSNVTGYAPPIRMMSRLAKNANPSARIVVDAAQAIARLDGRSEAWGGDYAFFSGHKMHGPSGVGVLFCSSPDGFKDLSPGKFGGGMISGFRSDGSPRWFSGSAIYEAGSQNVAGAAGLAEAARELRSWDFNLLSAHEEALSQWLAEQLGGIDGVRVFGGPRRSGLVAFDASWAHAHDIGTVLDARGVMARVGHHCALPLMRALDCLSCVRFSFGALSTEANAMAAYEAVLEAKKVLS